MIWISSKRPKIKERKQTIRGEDQDNGKLLISQLFYLKKIKKADDK